MARYDLTGRAALVAGGARGQGAGMAAALAEAGAAVVIADIEDALGRETADALKQTGAAAAFVHLDVTDDASWERAVSATIGELGGLDILVTNAGVEISGPIADLDPAEVRRMLDVNVLGTALGLKHAFRAMRPGGPAGRGGAVVTVASVAAVPGIAAYSATKSAVDRLTRVAATEAEKLGYGVRVNCVYPDPVPAGTADGPVAGVADAVVFLASDAARFVTGAGLPVDGGVHTPA